MKKLYAIILTIVISQNADAQKIRFFYDEAGVRVKRSDENALPVTLMHFAVEKIEREMQVEALLEWETSAEENSDRFEIERSTDGSIWNLIKTVSAKGSKNKTSHYEATDVAPLEGQNYYRLKMIDRDDSFAYSLIRNIYMEIPLVLFPNPAQNKLFVSGILCERLQVFNSSGQMLADKTGLTKEGIDISHLPNGLYIVKIIGAGGETITKTIVKK